MTLKPLPPVSTDSPEVLAARTELGLLHDIFATLSARKAAIDEERARIQKMHTQIEALATDPKHEQTFAYLNALIEDAQARYDALVGPPPTGVAPQDEAPASPLQDGDNTAIPSKIGPMTIGAKDVDPTTGPNNPHADPTPVEAL